MLQDLIGSEDFFVQCQGVSQLSDVLLSGDEKQLNKFPYDSFANKLIAILKQQIIDDIQGETKSKFWSSTDLFLSFSVRHKMHFQHDWQLAWPHKLPSLNGHCGRHLNYFQLTNDGHYHVGRSNQSHCATVGGSSSRSAKEGSGRLYVQYLRLFRLKSSRKHDESAVERGQMLRDNLRVPTERITRSLTCMHDVKW